MHESSERPFTKLDAALLAIALILGIAWAWTSWPILSHIYLANGGYSGALAQNQRVLALHLVSTVLAPLTMMVGVLRLCPPRPDWRSSLRQPGVAACVAATAVMLVEVARYPTWLITIYGEVTRIQGDTRNNIVQYPLRRDLLGFGSLAGSIAHQLGPHAGFAVLGVVLAYWAARIPPTGPSWIDRLGQFLAASWVMVAIGFWIVPIS